MIDFPFSRVAGLKRLHDFIPVAGEAYAKGRNTDFGPDHPNAVSRLSPYLRYRVLTEEEVIAAVLQRHSLTASEKFVQEVLWRTYFKGWLEMRPIVWKRFLDERDHALNSFANMQQIAKAEHGQTGIDAFDHWAHELVETGYLHNHARMWFASIWIFTLRLPWALGADFFLRHLIDADPASNTLSWRWVAGLQTPGKTYLATSDNIERYTNGRFRPKGLARDAPALTEAPLPSASPISRPGQPDKDCPSLLLMTHEDMQIEALLSQNFSIASVVIAEDANLLWSDKAMQFVSGAATDMKSELQTRSKMPLTHIHKLDANHLKEAARSANVKQIITTYAPVGPVADALREIGRELATDGITLAQILRPWDRVFWPEAKRGFFSFKEKMAQHLEALGVIKQMSDQPSFFDRD